MLSLLLLACGLTSPPPTTEAPSSDAAEPVLTGVTAADLQRELLRQSEQIRVYNFWATWCGPCVEELPMLLEVAEEHDDVELTLVSLDLSSVSHKVVAFIRKHELGGVPNLQLLDPDPLSSLRRMVPDWPDAIPVTLVVAPTGKLHERFAGLVERSELEASLDRAR